MLLLSLKILLLLRYVRFTLKRGDNGGKQHICPSLPLRFCPSLVLYMFPSSCLFCLRLAAVPSEISSCNSTMRPRMILVEWTSRRWRIVWLSRPLFFSPLVPRRSEADSIHGRQFIKFNWYVIRSARQVALPARHWKARRNVARKEMDEIYVEEPW